MSNLPATLPQTLREHGLKVVEVPGWKTRGRPASTGGFDPVGVLCHHTATSTSSSVAAVLRLLVDGRGGVDPLPGPLCQLGLGRDGTVYMIAAGRANHAGVAKASGTVGAGDGNELYIGIEAFNNGVGEQWQDVQYQAYILLCAVLSKEITHNSFHTVSGHKETSITGKIDPTFDMANFRTQVHKKMDTLDQPDTVMSRGERIDHALQDLRRAREAAERHGNKVRVEKIQATIAALKLIKPAKSDH